MKEEIVIFKGSKEGLNIILKEDVPFNEIKKHFESKVKALKTFLTGSKITIKFSRSLKEEEIQELVDIIKDKGKAEVLMVLDDDNLLIRGNNFESILEGNAKFYKGTLRSGQSINYNGNVVVVGDVNAGAEIVASGNIIVLGILRGAVFAGANSNQDSFIAALSLKPMQIRISDVIGSPTDIEPMKGIHPEIVTIKENQFNIERLRLDTK